ncbi:protein TAPT1 homolog isoform X2 [Lingula anatina]|uniref:Protein TAPT1 homolog isoform X2 n=1 Tax=Lingula anatina TaxID=7574 RepID=A0A1S3INU4_LINAN|nr:protein TAPT1 homolog isoform X2 [Lingula anatina]|eukprot:XP_013399915.1 protein TAPT1 homolog isoform X2 [Lingula anatina]
MKTHPSVRIKGTENNYNPVQCIDPNCLIKPLHMHCPFCVKTDSYQDPVILKAHYRVKHVDKGLDFAGLKILRCCDQCDIVGAIKGEKKFKGAHWHCYKCRNGFNRRDEALKHYKTHFRNPQTTFQIQVTQEVNQMMNMNQESQQAADTIHATVTAGDELAVHPVFTETVITNTPGNGLLSPSNVSIANGKNSNEGEVQVAVAANETVGTSDPHIVIIQEEPLDTNQEADSNSYATQLNGSQGDGSFLQQQVEQLKQKNEQLKFEKTHIEQALRSEIQQLKMQIQMQSQEVVMYQRREQELLGQLSVSLDDKIQDMITNLQNQHQELLHQQLAEVKREFTSQLHAASENTVTVTFGASEANQDTTSDGQRTLMISASNDIDTRNLDEITVTESENSSNNTTFFVIDSVQGSHDETQKNNNTESRNSSNLNTSPRTSKRLKTS